MKNWIRGTTISSSDSVAAKGSRWAAAAVSAFAVSAVASRRTTGRSRQCVGERSKGKPRELLLLWRIPHFEATLMDSCWSFWWNVGGRSFVSPLSGRAGCFLRWENFFTRHGTSSSFCQKRIKAVNLLRMCPSWDVNCHLIPKTSFNQLACSQNP